MKKVIALVLVLGLFAAAPVMAEDSILTGLSQYEVSALADAEMSQIQGESTFAIAELDLHLRLESPFLFGVVGGVFGLVPVLFGVIPL